MNDKDIAKLKTRRADWVSAAHVGVHLSIVFAPVFLAAYFGGWSALLIGYLWFGLSQNGVVNLMHEAAHRMVFQHGWWSDFLGHRILAPFFLTSFELYRRRHWVHHHQTGNKYDTKTTYLLRFNGLASFLAFAQRWVGVEATKRFWNTLQGNKFVTPLTHQQNSEAFVGILGFQCTFFLGLLGAAYVGAKGDWLCGLCSATLAYGFVYIYGMASFTTLLSTLRAIAEHQVSDETDKLRGYAAIRNMRPTLLTRLFFGSYGFCEHGTHHRYPGIPHYNLRIATQQLAVSDPKLGYGASYWYVLARAIRDPHRRNSLHPE